MRKITGLYTYPVKSLRGVPVAFSTLDERGLAYDRAWMVVDGAGKFVTQRELPMMATIGAEISLPLYGLLLHAPGMEIDVRNWTAGPRRIVRIWDDEECEAIDQGEDAAQFLRAALDRDDLRLVYMPPDFHRPSRGQGDNVRVGFADGFPLLIASEESLADLNGRLTEPVPMDRFRPNIVVAGCDRPFEEDEWHTFTIAGIPFRGMKRCTRCPITMTDQRTGDRAKKEPLATLAKYRRFGKGACFGVNVNHLGIGQLKLGDTISVTTFAPPPT